MVGTRAGPTPDRQGRPCCGRVPLGAVAALVMGCGGGSGPEPTARTPGDAASEQAVYQEWLANSPVSPGRAVARLPVHDSVTLGPPASDIPIDGASRHVLRVDRGAAVLSTADGDRPVAWYRPVEVGRHRIALQGERDRPIVMVYGDPETPVEPEGFYPVDPELVFDLPMARRKAEAVRMLAIDGIEVEAFRVGTVTVTIGETTTTLEVRAVPDVATEETNLEIYFRDATNAGGSYPSGRFVTLVPLADDHVRLDFNRSRSPFCAYSTAYPCPVPWRGNSIDASIEAGERYSGSDTYAG